MNFELKNTRLVVTDLDGTFLKNDRSISNKNLEALKLLGEKKIIRAVATGRNLKKVTEVLNNHVPFDYIVYSSGAGLYNWKEKTNIYNQNISIETSTKLLQFFIERKLNFHAFHPSPENHLHWYYRGENFCEEFERYFDFNQNFASELNLKQLPKTELCQFLVIIKEDDKLFAEMKNLIESISPEIRVIRSSSPITKGYIWIEVFHRSVSKGNGVKQICELLNIGQNETLGLGNDYNDLDLLEFTNYSFLTENAPLEIKHLFPNIVSNENDAFAVLIQPLVQ
jgi:Cof subfamily protein (haloacid dehalogenase superfamily)